MDKDLFTRSKRNPILKPIKNHKWEAFKVYNPGVFYEDGKYHLYYRAMNKSEDWYSSIGYAVSDDGEHFKRFSDPLLAPNPKTELEKRGYEDPRITKVDDTYFMAYAVYDGIEPRLNIATSKDLNTWTKQGQAFKDFRFTKMGGFLPIWHSGEPRYSQKPRGKDEWSKAGAIFPSKIKNKFWMLFGDCNIWLAYSDSGIKWKSIKQPFIKPRKGKYFDNYYVEMGPPPIKTDSGWLVLYHGIDRKIYYRLGALLLDIDDPSKILYRSKEPVFGPKESYELGKLIGKTFIDAILGGLEAIQSKNKKDLEKYLKKLDKEKMIPKVIFCCGAVLVDGVLRIYYGASDTFICTATARLDDILKTVK